MESQELSSQSMDRINESTEALFHSLRRSCCSFPCFDRSSDSICGGGLIWWKKMSSSPLWDRGVDALKKIREWSEILAGPRWKTFIRRFNRNRRIGNKHENYQYDPLSYAMNFEQLNEEEDAVYSRNFSSRYAYARGSVDLAKPAPGVLPCFGYLVD